MWDEDKAFTRNIKWNTTLYVLVSKIYFFSETNNRLPHWNYSHMAKANNFLAQGYYYLLILYIKH